MAIMSIPIKTFHTRKRINNGESKDIAAKRWIIPKVINSLLAKKKVTMEIPAAIMVRNRARFRDLYLISCFVFPCMERKNDTPETKRKSITENFPAIYQSMEIFSAVFPKKWTSR